MTEAATRPAVIADTWWEEYSITGGPSGSGVIAAPVHVLLTGGEGIWTGRAQTGRQIFASA
jgi:hypothetical protein